LGVIIIAVIGDQTEDNHSLPLKKRRRRKKKNPFRLDLSFEYNYSKLQITKP